MWNLKSKKKLIRFTKEKVQEFTNEKLIIIFILFENNLVQAYHEEISGVKFRNHNLNKLKDLFFKKIYLENLKVDSDFIKKVDNDFFSIEEIDSLNKTHLFGLNKNEKLIFFNKF